MEEKGARDGSFNSRLIDPHAWVESLDEEAALNASGTQLQALPREECAAG